MNARLRPFPRDRYGDPMIDLLISALVQAAETTTAAPPPAPAAAAQTGTPSPSDVHCQWVLPTGSHVPQRVCMTLRDERRRTEDTEQDLHRTEMPRTAHDGGFGGANGTQSGH